MQGPSISALLFSSSSCFYARTINFITGFTYTFCLYAKIITSVYFDSGINLTNKLAGANITNCATHDAQRDTKESHVAKVKTSLEKSIHPARKTIKITIHTMYGPLPPLLSFLCMRAEGFSVLPMTC